MTRVCFAFLSLFFVFTQVQAAKLSPVGTWMTYEGERIRSIVEIKQLSNGTLSGTVQKIFRRAGDLGYCKRCPGHFKNKPIQGLTILWGLKQSRDDFWDGGHVLDPKNGKVYNANIKVFEDELHLRGYIKFLMLGRTKVWKRIK